MGRVNITNTVIARHKVYKNKIAHVEQLHDFLYMKSLINMITTIMIWYDGWYAHPDRYPHLSQRSIANLYFCNLYVLRNKQDFLDQPLAYQRERLSDKLMNVTSARNQYHNLLHQRQQLYRLHVHHHSGSTTLLKHTILVMLYAPNRRLRTPSRDPSVESLQAENAYFISKCVLNNIFQQHNKMAIVLLHKFSKQRKYDNLIRHEN